MSRVLRAVFDCNIFVQALISPRGPAADCLTAIVRGELVLACSEHVLAEVVEVAARPRLRHKFGITDAALSTLVELVREVAEFHEDVAPMFSYERDPDDAHYVNLALASDAAFIVTRDRDLLDLQTRHDQQATDFRSRFGQVQVIEPETLLERLEQRRNSSSGEAT